MKNLPGSALLILSLMTACSKDTTTTYTNPTSVLLVKSERYISSSLENFTIYMSYDNQNRISLNKVFYDIDTALNYRIETSYTTNEVTEKRYDVLNNLVETNRYFLNSRNLIDSTIKSDGNSRSKISYDADDHLITEKVYNMNNILIEIRTSVFQNSNLVSATSNDPNGSINFLYEYSDYDLSYESTLNSVNFGQSYKGKTAKNFAKKVISNAVTGTTEFDYKPTYDSSNRIIKITTSQGTSVLSEDTISYY